MQRYEKKQNYAIVCIIAMSEEKKHEKKLGY